MSITNKTANFDARKQLATILELAKTHTSWRNEDRELLRDFRAALGSPSEIAEMLHVAVSTIYGWERQTRNGTTLPPPPHQKLEKFLEIIKKLELRVGIDDTAVLSKIRTVKYLFECGEHSHTFWTLRSCKPFVALTNEKFFDGIIEFLSRDLAPKSFLIFPKKQVLNNMIVTEAKNSFHGLDFKLRRKLEGQNRLNLLDNLRPLPINREEAIMLGLMDDSPAFAMAEYTQEGYARYGKSVDVWMEFDFEVIEIPSQKRTLSHDGWNCHEIKRKNGKNNVRNSGRKRGIMTKSA